MLYNAFTTWKKMTFKGLENDIILERLLKHIFT